MKEQIIHPRLRRILGSAFEELGEKIVAYNPDVVCPILRGGSYVLDGVNYFTRIAYGKQFPSIDIVHISPHLSLTAKDCYSVNGLELEENRQEIEGKKVAVVDDLKYNGMALKNVLSCLLDMKASDVKTFCLYNDTSLMKKFSVSKFDEYWHKRVTSIKDMIACRKDYRKDGRIVSEIVFISTEEALTKLDELNIMTLPELHDELFGELMYRKMRRQLFRVEVGIIIDKHLKRKVN